jgi:hypothetical protein
MFLEEIFDAYKGRNFTIEYKDIVVHGKTMITGGLDMLNLSEPSLAAIITMENIGLYVSEILITGEDSLHIYLEDNECVICIIDFSD